MSSACPLTSACYVIAPAGLVMCDLLRDSVERVVASSVAFRMVERVGLKDYILQHRQKSYVVVTQVSGVHVMVMKVLNPLPPTDWSK